MPGFQMSSKTPRSDNLSQPTGVSSKTLSESNTPHVLLLLTSPYESCLTQERRAESTLSDSDGVAPLGKGSKWSRVHKQQTIPKVIGWVSFCDLVIAEADDASVLHANPRCSVGCETGADAAFPALSGESRQHD